MKKTKEQMREQRKEALESILAELQSRYEGNDDFSCVISVNDGKGTATICYGSALDLVCNIASIESDKVLAKVKQIKQAIDGLGEMQLNERS